MAFVLRGESPAEVKPILATLRSAAAVPSPTKMKEGYVSPILDQTDRRFMARRPSVPSLLAPALLAVTVLTVVASVPASANAPRITKPGPPTAVSVTSISEGASVSWTSPVSDGGSPITGYTVTASHRGNRHCSTSGATMCTVTGLADGFHYEIKVQASNSKGEGHASTRVLVTPLPTVFFPSAAQLEVVPLSVEV